MDDDDETLLVKPEVFLYKIPLSIQKKEGYIHRASDWDIPNPSWHGKLTLFAAGPTCHVMLEDRQGNVFGQAVVEDFPGKVIDTVYDSSRYFILKIQTKSGEFEKVGIGFSDRKDSADLKNVLKNYFSSQSSAVKRAAAAEVPANDTPSKKVRIAEVKPEPKQTAPKVHFAENMGSQHNETTKGVEKASSNAPAKAAVPPSPSVSDKAITGPLVASVPAKPTASASPNNALATASPGNTIPLVPASKLAAVKFETPAHTKPKPPPPPVISKPPVKYTSTPSAVKPTIDVTPTPASVKPTTESTPSSAAVKPDVDSTLGPVAAKPPTDSTPQPEAARPTANSSSATSVSAKTQPLQAATVAKRAVVAPPVKSKTEGQHTAKPTVAGKPAAQVTPKSIAKTGTPTTQPKANTQALKKNAPVQKVPLPPPTLLTVVPIPVSKVSNQSQPLKSILKRSNESVQLAPVVTGPAAPKVVPPAAAPKKKPLVPYDNPSLVPYDEKSAESPAAEDAVSTEEGELKSASLATSPEPSDTVISSQCDKSTADTNDAGAQKNASGKVIVKVKLTKSSSETEKSTERDSSSACTSSNESSESQPLAAGQTPSDNGISTAASCVGKAVVEGTPEGMTFRVEDSNNDETRIEDHKRDKETATDVGKSESIKEVVKENQEGSGTSPKDTENERPDAAKEIQKVDSVAVGDQPRDDSTERMNVTVEGVEESVQSDEKGDSIEKRDGRELERNGEENTEEQGRGESEVQEGDAQAKEESEESAKQEKEESKIEEGVEHMEEDKSAQQEAGEQMGDGGPHVEDGSEHVEEGGEYVEEGGEYAEGEGGEHVEEGGEYAEEGGEYVEGEGEYAEEGGEYVEGEGEYPEGGGEYVEGEGEYAEGEGGEHAEEEGGEYVEEGGEHAEETGEYAEDGGEYVEEGGDYAEEGGESAEQEGAEYMEQTEDIDEGAQEFTEQEDSIDQQEEVDTEMNTDNVTEEGAELAVGEGQYEETAEHAEGVGGVECNGEAQNTSEEAEGDSSMVQQLEEESAEQLNGEGDRDQELPMETEDTSELGDISLATEEAEMGDIQNLEAAVDPFGEDIANANENQLQGGTDASAADSDMVEESDIPENPTADTTANEGTPDESIREEPPDDDDSITLDQLTLPIADYKYRNGPKFQCNKCTETFDNGKDIKVHWADAHSYRNPAHCPVCRLPFPTKVEAATHRKKYHGFVCTHCSMEFKSVKTLQDHVRSEHTSGGSSSGSPKKPQFSCTLCPQSFKVKFQLIKHIESEHENESGQVILQECSTCHEKFLNQKDLDAHQVMHQEGHKCEQCSESFRTRGALRTHFRQAHPGASLQNE